MHDRVNLHFFGELRRLYLPHARYQHAFLDASASSDSLTTLSSLSPNCHFFVCPDLVVAPVESAARPDLWRWQLGQTAVVRTARGCVCV